LFFALTLSLMVLFVALVVDVGRLVVAQRQLQSIADLAALDAARVTGACSGMTRTDPGAVLAVAQAAAAQRDFLGPPYAGNLGAAPNSVEIGTVSTGADNRRQFTATGTAEAEAVRVALSQPVARSIFLPAAYGGTVSLGAVAVARTPAVASFSAGSGLLSLDSSQSALLNAVLGTLLGSSLNLDVVDYKGLANAQVNLLQLLEVNDLGVGTVEELLDADITVAQLLEITAAALQAVDPNVADILVGQILAIGVPLETTIRLGDLLALDLPASDAALSAGINVLDLFSASVLLANKDHFVDVPAVGLNVAIPGLGTLASVKLNLHIIEAPRLAVGPPGLTAKGTYRTEAHTSQIGLTLAATVADIDLNLLGLIRLDTAVKLDLLVQGAQTSAHLDSISCGGLLAPVHQVTIGAEPGLARVGIGTLSNPGDPGSAIAPTRLATLSADILGLVKIFIPVTVGADVDLSPGQPTPLLYTVDGLAADSGLPQMKTVGSDLSDSLNNVLSGLLSSLTLEIGPIQADVLGLPLGDVVNDLLKALGLNDLGQLLDALLGPLVDDVVGPLLGMLANSLLEPLLQLLGVSIGNADVTLISVEAGQPELLI
jgi:uncharacterized membrane protein